MTSAGDEQPEGVDIGTGEAAHTFGLALGTEFTFRASPGLGMHTDLKRPKGHPDGPTPTDSPHKKRTRTTVGNANEIPSPSLLFPPSLTEPSSATDDVFGAKTMHTKSLNTTPDPGSLFSFWQQESGESRINRNHQDFEELSESREKRELEEERMKGMRKDRQRVGNRERQQRQRDKMREIRVAAGWKPFQKRVSLGFLS